MLTESPDQEAPITTLYSPGNIVIDGLSSMEHESRGITDYTISFSSCENFRGEFTHVSSFSDQLKAEFKNLDCEVEELSDGKITRCWTNDLNIELHPGDVLGTVGGPGYWSNFDLGAWDYSEEHYLLNPDRWFEDSAFVVCPLDYSTPELKSELYERIGGWNGEKRTIEPLCGDIYVDIKGTAQGYWFPKGSEKRYSSSRNIALVHDNIDPEKAAFSIGNDVDEFDPGVYYFSPKDNGKVNRDFDDVVPGEVYCFEFNDFSIIVELITDSELKIEKRSSGKCGGGLWSFSNPAEFER
jgi:hypothetical protein